MDYFVLVSDLSSRLVIQPLYMLLLCLSMLSSSQEGQVIRLSPLYVLSSAEASSEVLTLQCYTVIVLFHQGRFGVMVVTMLVKLVLW